MYIPAAFREDDPAGIHALVREHSFATLVTCRDGRPFATHLPFLLDDRRGVLRTHLARANPQWRGWTEGGPADANDEALVIFQGPHAYVSPSWYATAPSVPTWNYVVVHAYGTPRLLDDAGLQDVLEKTVRQYEAGRDAPWDIGELPEEYVRKMRGDVVGVEIAICRWEGKLKLSQNRDRADREGVIAGLRTSADPAALQTADWMEQTLERSR